MAKSQKQVISAVRVKSSQRSVSNDTTKRQKWPYLPSVSNVGHMEQGRKGGGEKKCWAVINQRVHRN